MSTAALDGAGCPHLRQRHPRRIGTMLPCAWPTCPGGVAETTLSVTSLPESPPPESEEPLMVERRLLILEEGERVFIWHPTPLERRRVELT